LPSVLGDAAPSLPSSFLLAGSIARASGCSHNGLPSVRMHSRTRSLPLELVRKMRSPQITGVDPTLPGRGSFQTTFWDSLQRIGSRWLRATPLLSGPRQFGQLYARRSAAARNPIPTSAHAKRVMKLLG